MKTEILVAITAILGPVYFLTKTKLFHFDARLNTLFASFGLKTAFWAILDLLLFWGSLVFQVYYWLFMFHK